MSDGSPDGRAAGPNSSGGGGEAQSASERAAAPSSQPALLRLLSQLRSQQRRGSSGSVPNLHSGQLGIGRRDGGVGGGGGGGDGVAQQGSSGHVAVQIGSDGEGQPRDSPSGSGDASRLRGHSITTSEAGHLADAIDEHRMAGDSAAWWRLRQRSPHADSAVRACTKCQTLLAGWHTQ